MVLTRNRWQTQIRIVKRINLQQCGCMQGKQRSDGGEAITTSKLKEKEQLLGLQRGQWVFNVLYLQSSLYSVIGNFFLRERSEDPPACF